ncbi:MAG: family 43 glycosylhydrolase [Anaerolineaceae bacterium]|nr:family 43 glycosylhydrolase [Anaerolineaceae bacterium]
MKINRRQFLHSAAAVGFGVLTNSFVSAQDATAEATAATEGNALELTGNFRNVHDPVIIKQGDTYYLYCTGARIPTRSSKDLHDWQGVRPGPLPETPQWAKDYVPKADSIWAPDISFHNGKYYLYYSVSTFGSNHSCIGLETNVTLNPEDKDYKWEDQGMVIASDNPNNYNCIDPNWVMDTDGNAWLAFGSFWSGIKMRRLNNETGLLSDEDTKLYSLATRFENSGSIEGAFIIHKDDYYYLFASFDFCCRGVDSTYNVRVGRSENVTGPYVDKDDKEMLKGGGTQITFPSSRYRGPGHNSILQEDGKYWIVYHAYDAVNGGTPTLRIVPLQWDEDGWPFTTDT